MLSSSFTGFSLQSGLGLYGKNYTIVFGTHKSLQISLEITYDSKSIAQELTGTTDANIVLRLTTYGSYTENPAEFSIKNLNIADITQVAQTTNQVDFFGTFVSDVLLYNEYYPYGMLMPGRHGSVDSYRYGFNGKEKDDEVKGEGAQYDYGFRIYDPRVSRFLSQDPLFKTYPWYTPFQFAGNSPIWAIDLDGLESKIVILQTDDYPIVHERQGADDINYRQVKAAYYKAFAGHDGWVRGQSSYESSTTNWTGPLNGTLTIDATGKTAKIFYDGAGIIKQIESSLASGRNAINVWFFNPDPLVEGSEAFNETFWTYVSSIALEPTAELAVGRIFIAWRASKGKKAIDFVSEGKAVVELVNTAATKTFSNINQNSKLTILGKYKDVPVNYIDMAKSKNASFFDLGSTYNDLKAAGIDPFEFNKMFLDKIIQKGDEIMLNISRKSLDKGSELYKEIKYLVEDTKSYIWINDTTLIPKQ